MSMEASNQHDINISPGDPKPRPIPGFTISRDVLGAMSPIHRLAAKELIRKGCWKLADSEDEVIASVPGTHTHEDDLRGTSNVITIIDG